jgi:hypothetical protein
MNPSPIFADSFCLAYEAAMTSAMYRLGRVLRAECGCVEMETLGSDRVEEILAEYSLTPADLDRAFSIDREWVNETVYDGWCLQAWRKANIPKSTSLWCCPPRCRRGQSRSHCEGRLQQA